MKTCPHCLNQINIMASVCGFCTREIYSSNSRTGESDNSALILLIILIVSPIYAIIKYGF